MFHSRIIIIATVVLFGVYTYSGVSGQDVTQATTVELVNETPQPQVGNQTTFRPHPFSFFQNFQWPFRRFFRCMFMHHSHPLIPAGANDTELAEKLSPSSEASVNKEQSPCCWFNRTDTFDPFIRGFRRRINPLFRCLPFWRWHEFGDAVDSVDVSTTPAA